MALENGFHHIEQQDGRLGRDVDDDLSDKDFPSDPVLLGNAVKENRQYKKAKRTLKASPHKQDGDASSPNGLVTSWHANGSGGGHNHHNNKAQAHDKNSRKSRDGRGRGMPKKGGAGGKGTWGLPGSELYETGECRDFQDPNYDSDNQGSYIVQKVTPALTPEEAIKAIEPILLEYLENGDAAEARAQLEQLNLTSCSSKVLEMAINLALDRHNPQRELMSRLIADLHGNFLSQAAIGRGFDDLLGSLSDLTLDTPEASEVLGQFIARALADDCLPSDFVETYKGRVESNYVRDALEKADVLLTMNHGIAKLDNVWGQGGGLRPVRYLTNRMQLLLKEYLSSGDIVEATRCLKELDVPHFNHELVYQAAVMAIEESSDRSSDKMVQLLKSLTAANIVTPDQFSKGAKRVFDQMPDICLDVPAAYTLLERLGNKLHDEGIMNEQLYKEMPVRGRKRFVSEGDGGLIKEPILKL